MKEINVLYTLDHKYVKYMLVSLYSLIEHNPNIKINFHIICDNFEIEDYKLIEDIVASFDNTNVIFYDFKKIEKIIDQYHIPPWRGKKIPNARLFFNECINSTDKLLYLDSDTIVVNSLNGLDEYNGPISMVQDSMPRKHWKQLEIPVDKYYNSGVLYIDTKKWDENNCSDKIKRLLDKKIPYEFPDQDIINMALKDDIKLLPPEYNLFSVDSYFGPIMLDRFYSQFDIKRYDHDTIMKAKEKPIILHSTPFYHWNGWEKNAIHPYKKYYSEYFKKLNMDLDDENEIKKNPLLFRLYLYLKFMVPQEAKDKIKQYIKK